MDKQLLRSIFTKAIVLLLGFFLISAYLTPCSFADGGDKYNESELIDQIADDWIRTDAKLINSCLEDVIEDIFNESVVNFEQKYFPVGEGELADYATDIVFSLSQDICLDVLDEHGQLTAEEKRCIELYRNDYENAGPYVVDVVNKAVTRGFNYKVPKEDGGLKSSIKEKADTIAVILTGITYLGLAEDYFQDAKAATDIHEKEENIIKGVYYGTMGSEVLVDMADAHYLEVYVDPDEYVELFKKMTKPFLPEVSCIIDAGMITYKCVLKPSQKIKNSYIAKLKDKQVTPASDILAFYNAIADDYGDYRYRFSDSGVTITGYLRHCRSAEEFAVAKIPEKIVGQTVFAIGQQAITEDVGNLDVLLKVRKIKIIHIPETITYFGAKAIYKLDRLKEVHYNPTFTSDNSSDSANRQVYGAIIQNCNSDFTISYGEKVTHIPAFFVNNCGITKVSFPENCKSIGSGAFRNNPGITIVDIPEGVTWIGELVFRGCSGVTDITIPSTVTAIGPNLLSNDNNLSSVTYNAIAKNDGSNESSQRQTYGAIIQNCNSDFTISYGDDVYHVPSFFVNNCGITKVSFPENCKSIGSGAFRNNPGVTIVDIPEGVTWIGELVFRGCSGVTDITIPSTVTAIGPNLLTNDNNLSSVTYNAIAKNDGGNESSQRQTYGAIIQNCNSDFTISYGDDVYCVPPFFVNGCGITEVSFPEKCTVICSGAFRNNSKIATVNIPEGVTHIGESAFAGCSGVKVFSLPKTISTFGPKILTNANSLEKVTYNGERSNDDSWFKSDRQVYGAAINNCKSGFSVEVGNSVVHVPSFFIGNCSVKSILLSDSVKTIGESAFKGNSGLEKVDFPESVKSISSSAFKSCADLKTVTIYNTECSINKSMMDSRDILVKGYTPSTAEKFANNYGYPFCPIGRIAIKIVFNSSPGKCEKEYQWYVSGDPIKSLPEASLDGYDFIGWHTEDGTVITAGDTIDSDENINLYPGWKHKETHRITHCEAKQSSCVDRGNNEYWYCEDCNKYYSDESCLNEIPEGQVFIDKLPHSMEEHEAVAPTCDKEGTIKYYYCINCHRYYRDANGENELSEDDIIDPPRGHAWGEWIDAEPSSCIMQGQRYRICGNNNEHIQYEDSSLANHNIEKIEAADPTCTGGGNIEYWHCTECGKDFKDSTGLETVSESDVTVPPLGHNYVEVEGSEIAPTCIAAGKHSDLKCTRCDDLIEGDEIPIVDHTWNNVYTVDIAPSCINEGLGSIHCIHCVAIKPESSRAIPKIAHNYGAWQTTTPATELSAGQQSRSCTMCGKTETQTIAPLAPTLPGVKIIRPKAAKKSAIIKWKKVRKKNLKQIKKVEIQYSADGLFNSGVSTRYASAKKTFYKIKIPAKQQYFVRIRAYTNGHVSAWSTVRAVTAK